MVMQWSGAKPWRCGVSRKGSPWRLAGRVAIALLSVALVCGTGLPLVQGEEWWIRLFDFPRIQIAALLGLTLAGHAALRLGGSLRPWEHALAAMAGLALAWQLVMLAPYTVLHPREMASSRAPDNANRISLLVYNVLSDNRDVAALRDLIRDTDPDIILLSEPTQWWLEQLDGLEDHYPHTLFQPQENQYGKLLYSRLELDDPEIRFLIEPGVPSIRTQVRLRSGTVVTLYGVHPRPPGLEEDDPQEEDAREDADARNAELITIAQEVGRLGDAPVIVAGDFNDVPWSRNTSLFQRIGGLLDPRVGRGLFATFNTGNRLLRYPLDHVYASRHFLLVELRRLPDIGSDHFPLLVVLDFDPDAAVVNEEPQSEAGDQRSADEATELEP